jgi:ribosomal protein S18 acetylase RimI-like enzyme
MLPCLMNTIRFTTALDYTFAQLTEMHNISFTGYFFPSDMTPESTASMYRAYQVAPQHCIAMHTEDGTFVGFAKLALRGTRAWCAGFGIAPAFRGKGMGKLLVAPMIEEARKAGAATLQLEVLAQNTAAFKLYSSAGFIVTRQLVGMQIATADLPNFSTTIATIPVTLDSLISSIIERRQPDWEHELPSILATHNQAIVTAGPHSTSAGLVFQRTDNYMRVLSSTPSAETTPEEMAALLAAAANGAPTIQVYNEPEGSISFNLYNALGFQEFFRQYEMLLHLL